MARKNQPSVFARQSAGLLATLPIALYGCLLMARWLPVDDELRMVLAYYLPLPLYVALACLAVRAENPLRVWLICLTVSGLLWLGVSLSPDHPPTKAETSA